MKKLLLTLFVLGLLVFAAIAAIPVLTKVVGPDMIPDAAPPTGLPFGYREFPIPEQSMLAVKLDLPLSALETRANQGVPRELSGVEWRDIHKKIKNAKINWKMMPGQLAISNTGNNLAFNLPVEGVANAEGHFGLLRIGVKGKASMGGNISGSLTPVINTSWQVDPNLTSALNVDHAVATFGRNGSFDARAEVQEVLRPKMKKEEEKIGPALTEALNMKDGIQNLWTKAHFIRKMTSDPDAWLVFDPALAQMGPIDYTNPSSVSVTVGLVAQTFITNAEVQNRQAEKIPYLNLVPENPVTALRVPIIANLKALNASLADDGFLITTDAGAKFKVSRPMLELAEKGMLNLSFDINTLAGVLGTGISGRIKVQARPIVDCKTQSIGFTDVKMAVQTREFISGAAAWLFEDMLVKAIEREMKLDLNNYLPKVEDEIYKIVNAAPVPEDLELHFEKPDVELLGVYTIERNGWNEEPSPGIVFVFGAKGDISVKLSKL